MAWSVKSHYSEGRSFQQFGEKPCMPQLVLFDYFISYFFSLLKIDFPRFNFEISKLDIEVAEPDPTRQTRPTRPDPNPTRLDFLRKSNWPDPTRPDLIRDQMAFNPIEIY
jgi:hypothetical protein